MVAAARGASGSRLPEAALDSSLAFLAKSFSAFSNVRFNAICPGLVDGAQTREIVAKLTSDVDGWLDEFVRRHQAIPRLIQPEDVGDLVAFLASDEARSITGAEIPIDAGAWVQLASRD